MNNESELKTEDQIITEAYLLTSASLAQKPMLCAVSHKDVAVMFLEWVHEQYWRTAKRVGHRWFKLNSEDPLIASTGELFNIFIKEMEEELSALELSAYYSSRYLCSGGNSTSDHSLTEAE